MTSPPSTMHAAVTFGHGGPDQIEVRADWPTPEIGAGEALVRVTAAGVNNTDIWTREGRYGSPADPDAVAGWKGVPLDFPLIQGLDIAGMVVSVGTDGDDAWIGRRVLIDPIAVYADDYPDQIAGSEVDGGFAEFHRCRIGQLNDVSASPLTDAQLACLPTAYGTALGMINRAACVQGERILVTGSSGGVGMAAIQLLLARGCHVIARTSPSKADLIRSAGVAEVSVRSVDDLDALAEVDAVVDVVGGDEFGSLVDRLRDGGRLVTAGAIAGPSRAVRHPPPLPPAALLDWFDDAHPCGLRRIGGHRHSGKCAADLGRDVPARRDRPGAGAIRRQELRWQARRRAPSPEP